MSEDSKPVIFEAKTARLMDIISETEKQFGNQISPTPGEVKRLELIRKMKQDTDKKEYMIMFNILMIGLSLISLVHFSMYGAIISAVKLAYFLFFPFFTVFLVDLIRGIENNTAMWMAVLIAAILSTLGWWIYFRDERDALKKIESDLKLLEYI